MHYKNGREAHNGDKVIMIPPPGNYPNVPIAGILYDAVAGNDYCNGKIAITSANDPCPNLKECLHADDVAAASVPDLTLAPPAPVPPPPDAPAATKPLPTAT